MSAEYLRSQVEISTKICSIIGKARGAGEPRSDSKLRLGARRANRHNGASSFWQTAQS
jgi:hypothetical protein